MFTDVTLGVSCDVLKCALSLEQCSHMLVTQKAGVFECTILHIMSISLGCGICEKSESFSKAYDTTHGSSALIDHHTSLHDEKACCHSLDSPQLNCSTPELRDFRYTLKLPFKASN